jgi:hypothetical protein
MMIYKEIPIATIILPKGYTQVIDSNAFFHLVSDIYRAFFPKRSDESNNWQGIRPTKVH